MFICDGEQSSLIQFDSLLITVIMQHHETLVALAGLVLYVNATMDYESKNHRPHEGPCTVLVRVTHLNDDTHARAVDCFDPFTNKIVTISGTATIQNELLEMVDRNDIISNESTMTSRGAYRTGNGRLILPKGLDSVTFRKSAASNRKISPYIGNKTMLALRVIAADAETTMSEAQISDGWFGTYGDPVNLKSQYSACSYGKLVCNPYNSATVSNGVYTVSITNNVSFSDNKIILQAALDASGGLIYLPDYVMVCIPPGTSGDWIAYAYINSPLSVYNDNWCNSISAQMHGK